MPDLKLSDFEVYYKICVDFVCLESFVEAIIMLIVFM